MEFIYEEEEDLPEDFHEHHEHHEHEELEEEIVEEELIEDEEGFHASLTGGRWKKLYLKLLDWGAAFMSFLMRKLSIGTITLSVSLPGTESPEVEVPELETGHGEYETDYVFYTN